MNPDPTLQNELLSYLGQLGSNDQARVVDFARTLAGPSPQQKIGIPGKQLLKFAGTIPHEDCEEMKRIIEEGCERIAFAEW